MNRNEPSVRAHEGAQRKEAGKSASSGSVHFTLRGQTFRRGSDLLFSSFFHFFLFFHQKIKANFSMEPCYYV
jgi:hypothetical protein